MSPKAAKVIRGLFVGIAALVCIIIFAKWVWDRGAVEREREAMGCNVEWKIVGEIQEGSMSAAQKVLDCGFSVHKNSARLLRAAVSSGREDIILFFLEEGADINADNGGALKSAVRYESIETVKLLLDCGASLTPEVIGEMSLAGSRREKILPFLLNYEVHVLNVFDRAHLLAIYNGDTRLAINLIARVRDVNDLDGLALRLAVRFNNLEVVEVLLKAKADPAVNKNGPLAIAAELGHKKIVERLIAAGVDVREGDAMDLAREKGHRDILKLLRAVADKADADDKKKERKDEDRE